MLSNTWKGPPKPPLVSRECIKRLEPGGKTKKKTKKPTHQGWDEKQGRELKLRSSLIGIKINFFLSCKVSLGDSLPGGHKK